MPQQTVKPITPDRLEALLHQREEMAARPRQTPREVLASWMGNLGVGVGVTLGAGVLLWALRAPEGALLSVSAGVGALAFALMMVWRGAIDEASDWRNVRAVRREMGAIRSEAAAQVRTLRAQLDAAFDEIEALERSLDQVAHERDLALLDLGREREIASQNTRRTFVPADAPAPQDAKDAGEMIRYFFDTGQHLSRRKAQEAKRWPAERHAAAQGLLVRAGVLAVNATQPAMLCPTPAEALGKLNTYLLHVRSQQPPVTAARDYVEED